MKLKALIAIFIALLLLGGCTYAPGYSGYAFWEMPEWVPELPLPEYHSSNALSAANKEREPIPDPKVKLDSLPTRRDSDIVRVKDYIPDLQVELRYATPDNFTKKTIYEFTDLYLRYGTVVKLMSVQQELRKQGLLLKVWDGFRPVSAQYDLWTAYPNPVYVANPVNGYSDHSRGSTLDVTLVDALGYELEMPSRFDDFTAKADRDYSDCTENAANNAKLLQTVMEKYGFAGYDQEWWHYSDTVEYDVEGVFDPGEISQWYAVCNEYINIRTEPNAESDSIGRIPKDGRFTLLGWSGDFAYVEFQGTRGYVNSYYMDRVS